MKPTLTKSPALLALTFAAYTATSIFSAQAEEKKSAVPANLLPPNAAERVISDLGDVPPNPRPGECYVRVKAPAKFDVVTKQVLVSPATERVEIEAGETREVDKKLLVKPERKRYELVAAEFKTEKRKVLVRPEQTRLVQVPAEYKTVEEKILVKPEQFVWKRGADPLTDVNNMEGDIMCLVKQPAEYRTLSKRVLVKAESTKEEKVKAEYKSYDETVLVKPASVKEIVEPAEYTTMKVVEVVRAPSKKMVPVKAKYETVEQRVMTAPSQMVWKRVLCRTNINGDTISRLQKALVDAGYDSGKVNGALNRETMTAVKKYQTDHNLAQGSLTYEFLDHIGVTP